MQCKELIKGIQIISAGVAGVGTSVPVDSLFASAVETFNEICVFNDADAGIKVEWTNDKTGVTEFFILPNGGKSFTHKLNLGSITNSSLKVYSLSLTVAVTGTITINLSQN